MDEKLSVLSFDLTLHVFSFEMYTCGCSVVVAGVITINTVAFVSIKAVSWLLKLVCAETIVHDAVA